MRALSLLRDGTWVMHNQQGCCRHHRDHNNLNDIRPRTSDRLADLITVHTFGGRGSPSF